MTRLAREVGEAARVLENDLPSKQARGRVLAPVVDEARRLERLMAKRRRLRRELRALEADIKHSKRMLKALAGASAPPRE